MRGRQSDPAQDIPNGVDLREGIERRFFHLLYSLYKPFLSHSHLQDRHQYTIYQQETPIGILQLSSQQAHFMQIALTPQARGNKIAQDIILKAAITHGYKRIGWTADKANYPSLRLLQKLGGGIVKGSVAETKKKAEGRFDLAKSTNPSMQQNLAAVLSGAKHLFEEWHVEYLKRENAREALDAYLRLYLRGQK